MIHLEKTTSAFYIYCCWFMLCARSRRDRASRWSFNPIVVRKYWIRRRRKRVDFARACLALLAICTRYRVKQNTILRRQNTPNGSGESAMHVCPFPIEIKSKSSDTLSSKVSHPRPVLSWRARRNLAGEQQPQQYASFNRCYFSLIFCAIESSNRNGSPRPKSRQSIFRPKIANKCAFEMNAKKREKTMAIRIRRSNEVAGKSCPRAFRVLTCVLYHWSLFRATSLQPMTGAP